MFEQPTPQKIPVEFKISFLAAFITDILWFRLEGMDIREILLNTLFWFMLFFIVAGMVGAAFGDKK